MNSSLANPLRLPSVGVNIGFEVDQVRTPRIFHALHLHRGQPDRLDQHLVLLDLVADRILAKPGRLTHDRHRCCASGSAVGCSMWD